jgi:integrase
MIGALDYFQRPTPCRLCPFHEPSRIPSVVKRAGLRSIRFHDLRHTFATLLLSKNVNPKVVSEMLGHSSISITLDIYSHVLPDMQEKAVDAWRRC